MQRPTALEVVDFVPVTVATTVNTATESFVAIKGYGKLELCWSRNLMASRTLPGALGRATLVPYLRRKLLSASHASSTSGRVVKMFNDAALVGSGDNTSLHVTEGTGSVAQATS